MAICDAKYKFTMINIGDSGSHSDGWLFANFCFGRALNKNLFPFASTFSRNKRDRIPSLLLCWRRVISIKDQPHASLPRAPVSR